MKARVDNWEFEGTTDEIVSVAEAVVKAKTKKVKRKRTGYSASRWTKQEDKLIKEAFDQGVPMSIMAKKLRRTTGACHARLYRMGVK